MQRRRSFRKTPFRLIELLLVSLFQVSSAFFITASNSCQWNSAFSFIEHPCRNIHLRVHRLHLSSDWSSFVALDYDDDNDFSDKNYPAVNYAREEDSQDCKAVVGSSLAPPSILQPTIPIHVPAGSALALSEESVLGVLSACREELGTLFGYSSENRGVGITGGVDYVEMDGPTVVLSLNGRYWHQRTTVLARISNYLIQRIPEIVEVTVSDPYQLTDEANNTG